MVSRSFQEGQGSGEPTVELDWVLEASAGLIALSGGIEGDVGQALGRGRAEDALARAKRWQAAFGDRYYLELTRCGRPGEEACLNGACAIAVAAGIGVVATNDVRFLAESDFDSHEARLCIAGGNVTSPTPPARRASPRSST